jgi:ligand-binding sensor domain-containing protein
VSGRDVWLASEDRGVIRFRAGKFESFDRASGLPSSWFVDVAPAAGGGVWAATLRNGAVRLDSNGRVRELGANPHAWGLRLYNDGGKMLFGTQQGLGGDAALPDPRVHALLRTARGLWVGTEGGLALISDAPRGASLTGLPHHGREELRTRVADCCAAWRGAHGGRPRFASFRPDMS